MAYGLLVLNSTGKTVIDSRDPYANSYISAKGTVVTVPVQASQPYPPVANPAYVNGDLVLAHPVSVSTFNNDGTLGRHRQNDALWPGTEDGANPGGFRWAILKTSGALTPGTGYGLEVYDAAGDIIFQASAAQPQILYSGKMTSIQAGPFSCAGYNMNNIYGVMNNTTQNLIAGGIFVNLNYFFANGAKNVYVNSESNENYFAGGLDYMIVHLIT